MSKCTYSSFRAYTEQNNSPPCPDGHPYRPQTFLRVLGPGLVTGAADDDPSGIATYSQVGAQFGYSLGWTMLFSYPLMAAMQGVSAGIGVVTGQGIAQNLRRHYSPWLLRGAVVFLFLANFINIGVDLAAMGAAVRLFAGGPEILYTLVCAALCVTLEVMVSYRRYASVLKWLALSLLTYAAVVMTVNVPWYAALQGALIPRLVFDREHAMALVAVFGTTISPYLFFLAGRGRS